MTSLDLPTQLAAAYEIVGSPDKRAVFDDFGTTDMTSEDSAGFQDYAEYAASGRKATRDFYTAEECVLIWVSAPAAYRHARHSPRHRLSCLPAGRPIMLIDHR